MNAQKGFTLIELMIVVAIIGILAAIAIPQYQNYIAKSQVSRVMSELGGLRTAVETCMMDGIEAACELGATNSNLLGATVTNVPTGTVVNIDLAANTASIQGTFGGNASSAVRTSTLTWSRNTSGSWSCDTTVNAKYKPAGCSGSGS